MMQNNQANNHKNSDQWSNNPTRNPQVMTQTKTILQLKQAKPNDQQVEASFKIANGVKTKETIRNFCNGDVKELLIKLEK